MLKDKNKILKVRCVVEDIFKSNLGNEKILLILYIN
jgi:hypothetical protein